MHASQITPFPKLLSGSDSLSKGKKEKAYLHLCPASFIKLPRQEKSKKKKKLKKERIFYSVGFPLERATSEPLMVLRKSLHTEDH